MANDRVLMDVVLDVGGGNVIRSTYKASAETVEKIATDYLRFLDDPSHSSRSGMYEVQDMENRPRRLALDFKRVIVIG